MLNCLYNIGVMKTRMDYLNKKYQFCIQTDTGDGKEPKI